MGWAQAVDNEGRTPEDIYYEPPCDVSGRCDVDPADEDKAEAMCIYCGGWRYRDHPVQGNWGVR